MNNLAISIPRSFLICPLLISSSSWRPCPWLSQESPAHRASLPSHWRTWWCQWSPCSLDWAKIGKGVVSIFLSPVNDDVSVCLHKAEGNKKPKLGWGNLSCCPDCLPDPVHMRVAELSLEIQEKPGEKWIKSLLLIWSNSIPSITEVEMGKVSIFLNAVIKSLIKDLKWGYFPKTRSKWSIDAI